MKAHRSSRSSLAARLLGLALALVAAQACTSNDPEKSESPPPATPTGSWELAALPEQAEIDVSASERTPTFVVSPEGGVSGHSGVNTYHGQFDPDALADGRLQAGPMISTRMAGPPAAMALEQAFLEALARADGFGFEADGLVLTQGGEPVARFTAAP